MDTGSIIVLTFFWSLIALCVILYFLSKFEKVTVHEFENVVLFRSGKIVRVAGPGRVWVYPGRTTYARVDLRPTVMQATGLQVQCKTGAAVISATASVRVADAKRWLMASNNNDAAAIALESAIRRGVQGTPVLDRDSVEASIRNDFKRRLDALGMECVELDVTELSTGATGRVGFNMVQ